MDLMVNDFTYKALKERVVVLFDSYAKRTFIHIDDAVDCYVFALENFDKMKGKVFNAGGEHLNYSKLEIAKAIQKHIDYQIVESDVKDKDLRHFLISYQKIRTLGYFPRKTLDDGIVQLLKIFSFYDYFMHYRVI
jgi:nucleoside-diphosphate-sugar epimerase